MDKYYYGHGKVFSRKKGTIPWRWWGDVSVLTFGASEEKGSHKESFSGTKGKVRTWSESVDMNLNMTVHQFDAATLVQLLNGKLTTIGGGTVTGETFPTVAVGDILKLDKPFNVTNLVITDSTPTTPATYDVSNYDLAPAHGSLEILAIPGSGITQPFKAAYTYAGAQQVAFLAGTAQDVELRYEGINVAEEGAPVICEWYKVSTGMLQEMAMITSGAGSTAGFAVTAEVLKDTSKPAGGALGQYGRIVLINPTTP